jgi:hypothetical protein
MKDMLTLSHLMRMDRSNMLTRSHLMRVDRRVILTMNRLMRMDEGHAHLEPLDENG